MADSGLPKKLQVEIVSQEGLLLREEADEVTAPGVDGYFGVRPGHTPFLTALGSGDVWVRKDGAGRYFTCFGGFCEVLPDRVNILAANVSVSPDHTAFLTMTLQVASVAQLAKVMSRVEQLKDVLNVQRDLA